jgi:hypothetical protein
VNFDVKAKLHEIKELSFVKLNAQLEVSKA